jgi:hypothetical protein
MTLKLPKSFALTLKHPVSGTMADDSTSFQPLPRREHGQGAEYRDEDCLTCRLIGKLNGYPADFLIAPLTNLLQDPLPSLDLELACTGLAETT